jgi:aspartate 1-decarboxylase
MFVKLLKSKLHRARVTDTKVHYPGSIAIDPEIMEAAGIVPYEFVLVADVDNGNRLQTYAVPGESGMGEIVMLGAAAKLIEKGDLVIIFSFGYYDTQDARNIKPRVVTFNHDERPNQIEHVNLK